MADPVTLAALGLDAALGWPRTLYRLAGHPVGWFARLIDAAERRWNGPERRFGTRRLLGLLTVLLLAGLVGGTAWLVQSLLLERLGAFGWAAVALLAWPAIAQRSLFDHVRAVADALDSEGLPAARVAVGAIVGRDTAALDESGISRAAIESLAESFCDGVTAPAVWLLFLGLPGVWTYKAVNTADSLIGHREERWRAFGWAAARADDLLNLVPARLSALLICLAGGGGWRILRRDAGKHASPNAGWPEAAMAGALGLRLAGPIAYDGVLHDKPWIGDGARAPSSLDIRRALRLYLGACALLWLLVGGAEWAL
ncbi:MULTISPECIES: adenosylcobinamide-phosphate synthase CbiB [Sphingopyxis]|uniref:Cobalamin biosynthesis protein CobD n=1 Tax=Sphingopyxis granuli TaxID=267128 RepID=A0AA86L5K9_9SPHN|nr:MULTISPECIES: adenosylcobinamide-phosphate synthase CbiB [Sphingopyxis]AMG75955.1 Cobalamin biosynthesis protein CobD [Sphingopyxis granuli]APW73581.1 cobalamin biosynthesis protein CobD [Sphingopyxis granuli]AVA14632.1 cobalamin biosynthesis protein CobD [Sphingopyxis sp. MG]